MRAKVKICEGGCIDECPLNGILCQGDGIIEAELVDENALIEDLNKNCSTCIETKTCKQKQFNKDIRGVALICWRPVEVLVKQRTEFIKDLKQIESEIAGEINARPKSSNIGKRGCLYRVRNLITKTLNVKKE